MQRARTVHTRKQLFVEAVRLVEREYASDLDLDTIARRLATSRRQLQRAFAEIGETTFRTHLRRVRMMRAAELLTTTALPVQEIAHQVGYNQPAQFAKSFRAVHGSVPSAYRVREATDAARTPAPVARPFGAPPSHPPGARHQAAAAG